MNKDEVTDKGSIQVLYQVHDCTGIYVMCIKAVEVIIEKQGEKTHIVIHSNHTATINSDFLDDLKQRPFKNDYIYVKAMGSEFIIIRGFGFKVLYATAGRLYVVYEPYYLNKVSFLLFMCSVFYKNTCRKTITIELVLYYVHEFD